MCTGCKQIIYYVHANLYAIHLDPCNFHQKSKDPTVYSSHMSCIYCIVHNRTYEKKNLLISNMWLSVWPNVQKMFYLTA